MQVDEPTVEETIEILRGIVSRYEEHHQLKITDEALKAAAEPGRALRAPTASCPTRRST